MPIPEAERGVVDIRKLRDYCLSNTHPRGKHKARVFSAALGLGPKDAEWLRDRLKETVLTAKPEDIQEGPYGSLYTVDVQLSFKDKTALVRCYWIIRRGEDFPRLVTCYIL